MQLQLPRGWHLRKIEKSRRSFLRVAASFRWFLPWKEGPGLLKLQNKVGQQDKCLLGKTTKSLSQTLLTHKSSSIEKTLITLCQYWSQLYKNSSHRQVLLSKNPTPFLLNLNHCWSWSNNHRTKISQGKFVLN